MRALLLVWSILGSAAAHAAAYNCQVEHFRERGTAKAGAKICGEFRFETEGPPLLSQTFKDCAGAKAQFTRSNSDSGTVYVLEVSRKGEGTSQLITKSLPADFQLIFGRPIRDKKHSLSEEAFLACKQAQ